MSAEHRAHVHMALLQTLVGIFVLSSFVGTMLGVEYSRNGNRIIPQASAQVMQDHEHISVLDSADRYMECDCVGPYDW